VIASPEDEVPEERRQTVGALREVNDRLAGDERVDVAMLAVADGVTIARKR
jgi:predicted O-methyltransferase YrrM